MTDLVFHGQAIVDYDAAYGWYRERSKRASVRFEAEVSRVLDEISADPDHYPKLDAEHRYAILRRFPYKVIYSVIGSEAKIIAVAHARQAPDYWRDRN